MILLGVLGIGLPILIIAFVLTSYFSTFLGAPFVPTYSREIFEKVKFKKGKQFLDLGSGEGRIIRYVVKNFQVQGIGMEINPFLYLYSKILDKIFNVRARYILGNIFNQSLKEADYIYLFLTPRVFNRLEKKILKECKKGTIVISHGFPIPALKKLEINKIPSTPFPTYFYKI